MNNSHEYIYNHNLKKAAEYCNMAKKCLINNNIDEAKEMLLKASRSFEAAYEVGKNFNYEQAAFAEAKRKECLRGLQDLEFGKLNKVTQELERY